MTTLLDPNIVLGNAVTLYTSTASRDPVTGVVTPSDDATLKLLIIKPDHTTTELDQPSDVSRDSLGSYHATWTPLAQGRYVWRWIGNVSGASEGIFDVSSQFVARVTDTRDIRTMGPMVQRAVEGVVQNDWKLTPDQVKDITADACAQVLLYTGSVFGSSLIVTETDPVTLSPAEYMTDRELGLPEMTVISAQGALNYFFHQWKGAKVSESIADEASTWSYALSPNLLIAQLQHLQDTRDKALEAIDANSGNLESYVSFLAIRDTMVSRYIEPWVYGHPEGYGTGQGGLEGDTRFGGLPYGGGDYYPG